VSQDWDVMDEVARSIACIFRCAEFMVI
jgi:hypothetical protein